MTLDIFLKRQSTRTFLSDPLARQDIAECLEAARLAPSACNSQPWHFVVVDEPNLVKDIGERIFGGIYGINTFAKQAPVLVAAVSQKAPMLTRIGGSFRGTDFAMIDIGIAVQHFILQATGLGLSSCWIGWFNERQAKRCLKIPRDKKIFAIIALGYSQEPNREKQRKSLSEISSFNTYQP
ncbi:MAG: nitroreductase family protein [Candidatus Omnitrophota bacterium]